MLLFATVAQMGVSFIQQGIVVLGVFFRAEYHLTLGQMGLVVSSGTAGWMLAGLGIGTLVDRYGSRRVTFVGTLAMTVLACALFFVRELWLTCALLVLLGLVFGCIPLAGTKAVLVAWPRQGRGLPMGIRQMGVPLGSLCAALLLPSLAGALSLHAVFLIFAAQVFLVGLAFYHTLAPLSARVPPPALAPQDVTQDVTQDVRSARSHKPSPRTGDGENRGLGVLVLPSICGFLMSWGQYVLLTYTIPMLQGRGISVVAAGVVLAAAQVGGASGRIIFGAISDRLAGRRELVLAAIAAGGTLLAILVGLLPPRPDVPELVVLWLLLGASMVGWNALMLTWAGERVAIAASGMAMGLTTSAILFGAVISAPIFGFVVERSGSYRDAWMLLALLLGVAALLLTLRVRRVSRAVGQAREELAPSA